MPESVMFEDGHEQITSKQTMLDILDYLTGLDPEKYKGKVWVEPINGVATWYLEANLTTTIDVDVNKAGLGDHVLLMYGRLFKLTNDEYLAG